MSFARWPGRGFRARAADLASPSCRCMLPKRYRRNASRKSSLTLRLSRCASSSTCEARSSGKLTVNTRERRDRDMLMLRLCHGEYYIVIQPKKKAGDTQSRLLASDLRIGYSHFGSCRFCTCAINVPYTSSRYAPKRVFWLSIRSASVRAWFLVNA